MLVVTPQIGELVKIVEILLKTLDPLISNSFPPLPKLPYRFNLAMLYSLFPPNAEGVTDTGTYFNPTGF
jgi:hypothetical protein